MKFLYLFLFVTASALAQTREPTSVSKPLRGFITDRADKTEGPFSLLPGKFQFETDLFSYTYNKDDGEESSNLTFNNINMKFGLTHSSDIEFIVPTVVKEKNRIRGLSEKRKGLGDIIVRYKLNFFGNEGEDFAFGMIDYVKIPTAGADLSNRRLEGGFMLPMNFKIWGVWDLGMMVHVDHLRRDDNTGWQTDTVLSVVLGRPIYEEFSGFVELYSKTSDYSQQPEQLTFDFGFTYLLMENVQIDTGLFVGLTEASDDYTTFMGLSMLFD